MKKNVSPTVKKSGILLLISFIFTVLLLASCTKDDVTPNSNSAGVAQNNQAVSPANPVKPAPNLPALGSANLNAANSVSTSSLFNSPTTIPPEVPEDAMIYISHGACMGQCPMYSVTVMHDGTIIYNGVRFVGTKGMVQFVVDRSVVNKLRERMATSGFLELPDKFPFVGDMPETITALRRDIEGNGHFNLKIVVDWGAQVPKELVALRAMIEAELGIDKLVSGDTGVKGQIATPNN